MAHTCINPPIWLIRMSDGAGNWTTYALRYSENGAKKALEEAKAFSPIVSREAMIVKYSGIISKPAITTD